MDISVAVTEWGDFDPIRTADLPVSGRDGDGQPTPTVRELAQILIALPEQFQDLPVTRYCDDGVAGIKHALYYAREEAPESWTEHVSLW